MYCLSTCVVKVWDIKCPLLASIAIFMINSVALHPVYVTSLLPTPATQAEDTWLHDSLPCLPSTFLKDLRNGPGLDYGYESRAFSTTFKEALMELSDAIYLWFSLTRKWLISVFSFGLVDKLSTIESVLQVSCNKVFFREERGREGKICIAALCIWKLLTGCSPFNIRWIYSSNIF